MFIVSLVFNRRHFLFHLPGEKILEYRFRLYFRSYFLVKQKLGYVKYMLHRCRAVYNIMFVTVDDDGALAGWRACDACVTRARDLARQTMDGPTGR